MITINIDGRYDISGTNHVDIICLSTDTKPNITTHPWLVNGYRLRTIDDSKEYLYDQDNDTWIEWTGSGGGGGTTVVANPTLEGTEDDLTGLEVGETKYKVQGVITVSGTTLIIP